MSKRKKGNHGIYELTCISRKCGRRFKVMWEGQTTKFYNYFTGGELGSSFKLTYPFTGCPFCGAWWPTGPLDGEAYPKVNQSELLLAFMRTLNGRILAAEAKIKELDKLHSRSL